MGNTCQYNQQLSSKRMKPNKGILPMLPTYDVIELANKKWINVLSFLTKEEVFSAGKMNKLINKIAVLFIKNGTHFTRMPATAFNLKTFEKKLGSSQRKTILGVLEYNYRRSSKKLKL